MIFNFKSILKDDRPLIMGIVNITPDSFSDGGEHYEKESAVRFAKELIFDGTDIIDLGAQSTRPGYTQISPTEEIERLNGVLTALRGESDCIISVDTYYPEVADFALKNGADIINDVSGSWNTDMAQLIKDSGAGWVIMHNGAGSVEEVKAFFENMAEKCAEFGIKEEQICFDMGIGFGKTYEQNLQLIANIELYKLARYPILLGVSRKRVIGEGSAQPDPVERIYGNISADAVAIFGGVDIIRLHDVKNEKQGILMACALKKQRRGDNG